MDSSHDLELGLNSLVNGYGLVSVLEALRTLVEARAEAIEDSSSQLDNQQVEAFKDVERALTVLIKALPSELDIEIALSQISHTSIEREPNVEELTY